MEKFLFAISADLHEVGAALCSPLDERDFQFGSQKLTASLAGAAGLTLRFEIFGRVDLKTSLLNNILQRSNPDDFNDPRHDLIEMARLLSNVPEGACKHVAPFVRAICSSDWLDARFALARSVVLAGALVMLATHQSPTIVSRFWCRGLGRRLVAEIADCQESDSNELSAGVQFLGACSLVGWRVNRNLLKTVPLDRIGKLPTEVLPHVTGSERVEAWQRQLWFGLRVVASLTKDKLFIDRAVIEQTLNLWRLTLAETSSTPHNTLRGINKSMVRWLERCATTPSGQLLPNDEPLCVLTGFPRDPSDLSY